MVCVAKLLMVLLVSVLTPWGVWAANLPPAHLLHAAHTDTNMPDITITDAAHTDTLKSDNKMDTKNLDTAERSTQNLETTQADTTQMDTHNLDPGQMNTVHTDTHKSDISQSDTMESDALDRAARKVNTIAQQLLQLNAARISLPQQDTTSSIYSDPRVDRTPADFPWVTDNQQTQHRYDRHFSTFDVCADSLCDQVVRQANGLARIKMVRKYIMDTGPADSDRLNSKASPFIYGGVPNHGY
ncbi:uncharacterized protein [Cherax quadricarinatus]|uniref:uncharacterized protein isoform X2 n=1 Tax=Cherax quadricarinatus TaxID=27406 RepID=UPI00387EE70B